MLSLNDHEWKPFLLTDLFPEIQRGKRIKNDDHIPGGMPYVSSSSLSNGVSDFISNTQDVRMFSDCLSLANSGSVGSAFYEPFTFVASDHITHLKNPSLNKYHYLFIATMIKRMAPKYNFNREVNDKRIAREIVMLPVTKAGTPDFSFMADYMREKELKYLKENISCAKNQLQRLICNNESGDIKPLSSAKWLPFLIGELFEKLEPGRANGRGRFAEDAVNGVSYIGATNRNNGVMCFVDGDDEKVQPGNAIGFIKNGNGSAGYAIYKHECFISTPDVIFGYAEWLNRFNGLFIATCSDMSQAKYSHGYKWTKERLKRSSIMLPARSDGTPDFVYMESYMKKQETLKLREYIAFAEART